MHHQRTIAALLVAAFLGGPAVLLAQRTTTRNAPPADAPRFMVSVLKSTDKGLGVQAADAIRSRLGQDFPSKELWVIPKNDVNATLEASGFQTDVPLDGLTAQLLAKNLRADEFLDGTITKTPSGFRIESRMVLTRDANMTQPLPVAEGGRLLEAATAFSRSLRDARKQLAAERACELAIAGGKPDSAMTHARAAIAAYPRSTLGRVCLAQAMVSAKAPVDQVISIVNEVLEIDPRNKLALLIGARAYTDAKNAPKALDLWTQAVTFYPSDARLVADAVEVIARSETPRAALPIIQKAVQENPGDPSLMRLNWLILLAAREYKQAITLGEEMARTDTSAADTAYFVRLTAAYASDSQPQKAAEVTARGVAKFPNNATLLSLHSQTLRVAGQNQQALEAAKRALAANPRVEHGWYRRALIELDLGQSDSAMKSLGQAIASGEDKALVGQVLLVQGNQAYKRAAASKTRTDYETAVRLLSQADSVGTTKESKFLLGVASFQLGDIAVRENQTAKNCQLAKLAESSFTTAQIVLPAGGAVDPKTTATLLSAIPQYSLAVEGQIRQLCK
ncbi:MAG: tetratricopeptide repeat protein [Gemmatimonadaceae bacterium]